MPSSSRPADRPPLGRPLLSFAPLIYVAWADGQLEDQEIVAIRERLEATDTDASSLRPWLDPADPPTPDELEELLASLRRAAIDLPPRRARSLAELGAELAELAGDEAAGVTRSALAEVEEALGVVGHEATRVLVPTAVVPPAPAPEPSPPCAANELTRLLDGDRREVRQRVRRLLGRAELRYEPELPRRDYRERVLEQCRVLAAEGIGGLAFPVEHGGAGEIGDFIAAFETLAFGDASLVVKAGVQFGLFGGSIQMLGTERHHARYLPAVASLELPGCFAMSETGHGSNVRELETTATYDPASDSLIVHTPRPEARKDWIGNAALHGRMATVFAQLEVAGRRHGVHAVLVPIRDEAGTVLPGVTIEDCGQKRGLNGVDNGRIGFDRVRVPRENLLDRYGQITADGRYESPIRGDTKRFFTMLGTLVAGRVSVAAAAVSAAKTGLTIAVRYGDRRRQFGPAGEPQVPILDYTTHQLRLLPRVAGAYALTFAHQHLVRRYLARTDETAREVEALAAGLKSYASWFNVATLQTCRECCGGQGYLAVNRIGKIADDTDVYTTFEGDNVVLQQLVSRSLLTDFRQQLGESRFFNLLRFLARQAAREVVHHNPFLTRDTDEEHLRSSAFQLGALRYREEHLVISVARRLKRRLDDGMDSFDALLQVQDHLLAAANAHVERVVGESFAAAVEEVDDAALRSLLDDLRDLWVLWRLHEDRGWFLAQGVASAAKSKAVRRLVQQLCGRLRPHAVLLVDGFGIPDEVLGAPIALPGGAGG